MGARDLFSSRVEARAGTTHTEAPKTRGQVPRPSVLVLAAARVRGEPEPTTDSSEGAQARCCCGGLISRVSSLLAGREAASCERCRFFGHYSQ
ncbi:MAG: hypothetical protein RLZZ450_254 [Pseudomonadota bacterium]|jgi:hypothetical protein